MPKVLYCKVCSMPPEYCLYDKKLFLECSKWLQSKHPQIFDELKENNPDIMKDVIAKLNDLEKNRNDEETEEEQKFDDNKDVKSSNNNDNDSNNNNNNNDMTVESEVNVEEEENVEDSDSEDDLNKVEFIPMDDRYVKNISSKRQQRREGRNKNQNEDEESESDEENYSKLSRNQQRKLNYKKRKQQRQRNKNLKKNKSKKSNYQDVYSQSSDNQNNNNNNNNSNEQSQIVDNENKDNDNNKKKDSGPKKKIIEVGLALRRGKKKVTTVKGLMELGMKPKKAQTAFRKRFATGVGIDKKPTHIEIVIQGDVRYELVRFLRETYKVPISKLYYGLKNNKRERAIDNNGLIFPPP